MPWHNSSLASYRRVMVWMPLNLKPMKIFNIQYWVYNYCIAVRRRNLFLKQECMCLLRPKQFKNSQQKLFFLLIKQCLISLMVILSCKPGFFLSLILALTWGFQKTPMFQGSFRHDMNRDADVGLTLRRRGKSIKGHCHEILDTLFYDCNPSGLVIRMLKYFQS